MGKIVKFRVETPKYGTDAINLSWSAEDLSAPAVKEFWITTGDSEPYEGNTFEKVPAKSGTGKLDYGLRTAKTWSQIHPDASLSWFILAKDASGKTLASFQGERVVRPCEKAEPVKKRVDFGPVSFHVTVADEW